MTKISDTKKAYDTFNKTLEKLASISLSDSGTGTSPYIYDESKEKHLPPQLLLRYNYILDKLLTISVQIENSNNLLEIINIVFENGIETRIAVDATGLAEGGSLLNEIQITLLMICKMLLPPSQIAYMIKDECLGVFVLDRDREEIILELSKTIDEHHKLNETINNNNKKFKQIMPNVIQYTTLMWSQISQLCGYIDNYQKKIEDMNLEQFTTSRIKQLVKIYSQMNIYLTQTIDNVS